MAKYCGIIGYATTVERPPNSGVWVEEIVTRRYFGDVLRNYHRMDGATKINDDVDVSNTISVLADAELYEHCGAIRFIEWMGSKWNVKGVEINRPRLNLTIGGVYNGNET